MERLRRWFMGHWFGGVFAIIGGFWAITTIAWLVGADGIRVGTRYGPPATIDFMRRHDTPTLALAETVGLRLESTDPQLTGALVRVKPGPPVLCWLCGLSAGAGGIAAGVQYRSGDWFYRAPIDTSRNREAHEGRQESRDYILTIAYNRATDERVMVSPDATLEQQTGVLAGHGLEVVDTLRLSPAALQDLPTLSMTSEGCMIYNLAFVAAALLWLIVGGIAALILGRRRARRVATAQ